MPCPTCPVDAGADAAGSDLGVLDARSPTDALPGLDAPGDRTTTGLGCSADLREVLGVGSSRAQVCPQDQGCREGRCVPACEAAAASGGTLACRFLVASPPAYPPALPPCHAVFLTNAWPRPARVTASRGGVTLDVARFGRIVENARPASLWAPIPAEGIPEGAVAVLFLSSDPASVMPENGVPLSCPVAPAVNAATALLASGTAQAFELRSDTPVGAYDILPFGGARSHFPSASLLLPVDGWGLSYLVLGSPPGTHDAPGPQWLQVVARDPETRVRVRPTVDLPAGGRAPAVAAGSVGEVVLGAGELVQWQLPVGRSDLSGSLVVAERPVGVSTGNRFLRLQREPAPGGEATHQPLLPVSALSHEYVGAPYATRRSDLAPEPIPYRLVGAVGGTTLRFDPAIAGAPTRLEAGSVADFSATEAFVVQSQDREHPFAMAQLMTSANLPVPSRPGALAPGYGPQLGDEELVMLFPPAQFLRRYVFFTDPSYPTSTLTIVRERTLAEFSAVTIECLGPVTGFRPIGAGGRYEYTTVDLLRASVGAGRCTNGRQVISSDAPLGVVVWGLDSYSSYAYPAGGNTAVLQRIPTPL